MRLCDFNFAFVAYFLYIIAVTIASPTQEEQKSCQKSKLLININNETTSVKIVTDSGDTLFSVDCTNTKIRDLYKLFAISSILVFPEEGHVQNNNNSHLFVIKSPVNNGIELSLVNGMSETIFRKNIKEANNGLSQTDEKCAVIYGLTGTFEASLDVNHRDGYNITLLAWAAYVGRKDIVKNLVEKGAKVNLAGAFGDVPLATAIASGQADIVEYLIERGANVNHLIGHDKISLLHFAALLGRLECAKILLKHGANVTAQAAFSCATPLHYAAVEGHTKIVKELVGKGADVNTKARDGYTPLHAAAGTGRLEVVDFLIQAGADLNSKNKKGVTPLLLAITYNLDEEVTLKIVKLMVEKYSPDLNAKDNVGNSPLYTAGLRRFNKVQSYLRAHGAQK